MTLMRGFICIYFAVSSAPKELLSSLEARKRRSKRRTKRLVSGGGEVLGPVEEAAAAGEVPSTHGTIMWGYL